jgi:hypothetical protein
MRVVGLAEALASRFSTDRIEEPEFERHKGPFGSNGRTHFRGYPPS